MTPADAVSDVLIVFGRYPRPGAVKTRLVPALGAEGAAWLQRRMTERTLSAARALARRRPAAVECHLEGCGRREAQAWLGARAAFRPQAQGDLGRRMQSALGAVFADGARRALLVGTDVPGLTPVVMARALDALAHAELVLGPAADGGYYLIGATRRGFDAAGRLFEGMGWGGRRVLAETLAAAGRCGLRAALVDTLADVDRPEDLPHWIARHRSPADLPVISIVIPALDEAGVIAGTLSAVGAPPACETLVIDGGSRDGTAALARTAGARVFRTAGGKARQMNAGAALAEGEILLFLHADTRLPPGFANHVRRLLARPGVAAGAFRLGIDAPGDRALAAIAAAANLRARLLQLPYGDQALFMRAPVFARAGGYPQMPIMEDFALVRRLRRQGRIAIAPAAVATSDRRWRRLGVLRTWLINQAIVAGYHLGLAPERLARWYRRQPDKAAPGAGSHRGRA